MSAAVTSETRSPFMQELAKIPAFFRRDILFLWSYRVAFFSDWAYLVIQIALFYFINQLVPAAALPTFGGGPVTYLEFVTVGLLVTTFMEVSVGRLVSAVRGEQLMGTLESLLVTPTSLLTLQVGLVVYDILYVPLRMGLFIVAVTLILHVPLHLASLGPAAAVILAFIPVGWGLGVLSAAAVLTFRRGTGVVGLGVSALTILSGAFFPVAYLPAWLQTITRYNPLTMTLDAARRTLLGGAGWSEVIPTILVLLPMAAASLGLGAIGFRLALGRERRRGTLGLY